jgi:hypothetical protein
MSEMATPTTAKKKESNVPLLLTAAELHAALSDFSVVPSEMKVDTSRELRTMHNW